MYTLLMPRSGGLSAFLESNEHPQAILSDQLRQQALSAVGRDTKVPVFDSETITIGTTRSAVIGDDENNSALYTVNWNTYAWGFTQVPSLFQNNEIAMQQDFERKFLKYMYAFLDKLDVASVSALETAKNQVFADALDYAVTGNVIDATVAQRNTLFGDLSPIMKANRHYGPYMIVGNSGVEAQVGKMSEFGAFNQQDRTIQWMDKMFRFTTNIANATDKQGSGFIIQEGALGMLFRHEREAIRRRRTRTGHEWGQEFVPGTNIPLSTYYYESVGDFNAIAGAASADMTRVEKQHFGFSIDVAWVTPYNNDLTALSNPIVKFQYANA